MAIKLAPQERVVVDVTARFRDLLFPVLEAILITGVAWIAIGFCDSGRVELPLEIRNALVVLWALGLLWRTVLPVWRARRRRFVVTTRRIIVRSGKVRNPAQALALHDIRDAQRRPRGKVAISAVGYDYPLVFDGVAKPKRVVRVIQDQLQQPI